MLKLSADLVDFALTEAARVKGGGAASPSLLLEITALANPNIASLRLSLDMTAPTNDHETLRHTTLPPRVVAYALRCAQRSLAHAPLAELPNSHLAVLKSFCGSSLRTTYWGTTFGPPMTTTDADASAPCMRGFEVHLVYEREEHEREDQQLRLIDEHFQSLEGALLPAGLRFGLLLVGADGRELHFREVTAPPTVLDQLGPHANCRLPSIEAVMAKRSAETSTASTLASAIGVGPTDAFGSACELLPSVNGEAESKLHISVLLSFVSDVGQPDPEPDDADFEAPRAARVGAGCAAPIEPWIAILVNNAPCRGPPLASCAVVEALQQARAWKQAHLVLCHRDDAFVLHLDDVLSKDANFCFQLVRAAVFVHIHGVAHFASDARASVMARAGLDQAIHRAMQSAIAQVGAQLLRSAIYIFDAERKEAELRRCARIIAEGVHAVERDYEATGPDEDELRSLTDALKSRFLES